MKDSAPFYARVILRQVHIGLRRIMQVFSCLEMDGSEIDEEFLFEKRDLEDALEKSGSEASKVFQTAIPHQ